MQLEEKLQSLGYHLPPAPVPVANYVAYLQTGNILYISGQVPFKNGKIQYKGVVGEDISVEDGRKAANLCALNILAQVNAAVEEDWSRVKHCIKLGGFVCCPRGFTEQAHIINEASNLMVEVMGVAGRHTRFAVGSPALPLGAAVEIDAIFEIG